MISADGLKVYCYLDIDRVVDLQMEVMEGKHGRLILRGYLSKMSEITALKDEDIRVTVSDDTEEREQILFQGVIQSVYIFFENGVKQVIISAATYDIKLDQKTRSRSYQNISDTYIKIMRDAVGEQQGRILCETPSVKMESPVIQYNETDWEFCRRMAASMGVGVFSSPVCSFPQLRVGLVETEDTVSFGTQQYRACVDESYYHTESADGGKKEFLYYQVESECNYEIGSGSYYQGQKRYIFEKTAELVNNVLVFRYKLGGKCRFRKAKYYNEKLAGLSLSGQIEKTEKQSVYIKLDIDGQKAEATYAYPWTPVTGNFMYCMPQVGTRVYLYFADSDERNARAVSCIRTNASFSGFADYHKRGLVTEHGKQLQLYPDSLCFLAQSENACQSYRMGSEAFDFLTDEGKIELIGKEKLIFQAPKITVKAVQRIGQYKMKDYAAQKASEIYPKGSRNPATGGNSTYEQESGVNALATQGVLWGSDYENYNAFPDLDYEIYEEEKEGCPTWLKKALGCVVALAVGLAVAALVVCTGGFGLVAVGSVAAFALGATAGAITLGAGLAAVEATSRKDAENGTESSLGEYMLNSFTSSVSVGGALITMMLAPQAAMGGALLAEKVSIGLGASMLGGLEVTTGVISFANLFFQMNDVRMFYDGEKDLREPTGKETYDNLKKFTEISASFVSILGLGVYGSYKLPPRRGQSAVDFNQARQLVERNPIEDLGAKLEYIFGNATGSRHNIERSKDMQRILNSIGIFDNAEGRAIVTNTIINSFRDPCNGYMQDNGRFVIETLLVGPNGIAKMQTVWDGFKLITIELFKSMWGSFTK